MLTLSKVGARTGCKTDNRCDQPIQRTASRCQLAHKFVTWFVSLGPKYTCNSGKETTDNSLEIIEKSKTKHSKGCELQVCTHRCTFRRDFQNSFGNQSQNNTTSLCDCPAQGKAIFIIANANEDQPKRIHTSDFNHRKLDSKVDVLELNIKVSHPIVSESVVCQTQYSPKLRKYRRSLALYTIQRGSLLSSMEDRTKKLDSQNLM